MRSDVLVTGNLEAAALMLNKIYRPRAFPRESCFCLKQLFKFTLNAFYGLYI